MKKIIIKNNQPPCYYLRDKHKSIGGWYLNHSKSFMKGRADARIIKDNYLFIQLMDNLV